MTISARLRVASRIALLLATLFACLIPHGLLRLFRRPSAWPPRFLGLAARALGCDWRVAGTPLSRNVLFVSNHLSWIDILALGGAGGAAFVSKAEVGRWPIVGWLAGLNDTIYVERARRGAVRDQASQLRDILAAGRPVALFPEGTTGDAVHLLPFQPSLFAALSPPPPGLMVQPVLLDYADAHMIAWVEDEPAGTNALRVIGLPGRRRLTVRFLEPFDPAGLPDRKAIAAAARAAIAEALGERL